MRSDLIYAPLSRPTQKKGSTAKRIAKRKRAERPVIKAVRAKCVERDGYCRAHHLAIVGDSATVGIVGHHCGGPSEWAHLGDKKRFKTRGQAADVRHTTAGSLMLCKWFHDRYDGRQRPRLVIEEVTPDGADGPLNFSQGAL